MKCDSQNRIVVLRGSALPQAKLDEHDVLLIRQLISNMEVLRRQAAALSNAKIADKFGVHVRTIDRISRRDGWIHV